MITGKDPEYPDDQQVILKVSWLPLAELDRYDLYPPFLSDYILSQNLLQQPEGVKNAVPEFFNSAQ